MGGGSGSFEAAQTPRATPQSEQFDVDGRSHFGYVLYVHGSVGEEEKDSDEETSESMTERIGCREGAWRGGN